MGDLEELADHCRRNAGKPEAQRGYVSCPTSHSKQVAELGLDPGIRAGSDAPWAGSGWTEWVAGREVQEEPIF